MNQEKKFIAYRKSRFSTRLPTGRMYTQAHFWILHMGDDVQRVGLTKFATRMLGELVEMGAEVSENQPIEVGEVIGWVECLKAASDLFSMVEGSFLRINPELEIDPELMQSDPYARGWLYEARGSVEPNATDAQGYAEHLDAVISKMLGEQS